MKVYFAGQSSCKFTLKSTQLFKRSGFCFMAFKKKKKRNTQQEPHTTTKQNAWENNQ